MLAARHLSYEATGAFSPIVKDYLAGNSQLKPFYDFPPTESGLREAIERKKRQPVDRQLLVKVLKQQYAGMDLSDETRSNIESLLHPNSYTITTAHQPNLFTGPLYFIYKIIHAIRLAKELQSNMKDCHFVPVYYMGSEDADFAELNHTYLNGQKIEWKKEQKGAVGRMKVDKTLRQLISEMEGQLSIEKNGAEVIAMLRDAYVDGKTIQQATFELVNKLYGRFGLIVLIPDNPELKAAMIPVFEEELFAGKSHSIVQQTSEKLAEHYSPQAFAREINLFYLKDDIRERIEKTADGFTIHNTSISFTQDEIKEELYQHPERFSPNVILRGLYQETILPNIAFIGGGGELAYWLQLKDLFHYYNRVFPVLVLRNSFLVITSKWQDRIHSLGLSDEALFQPAEMQLKEIITKESEHNFHLNGKLQEAEALYAAIGELAGGVDKTLLAHVDALKTKAVKGLRELEKKMYRSEKRKFGARQNQVTKLKEALFPRNGLQERVENFSGFYALWGKSFIDEVYRCSPALEQHFTILRASAQS